MTEAYAQTSQPSTPSPAPAERSVEARLGELAREGWTPTPNALLGQFRELGIGRAGCAILHALLSLQRLGTTVRATKRQIAERAGLTDLHYVRDLTRQLEHAGLLRIHAEQPIERAQQSNGYDLGPALERLQLIAGARRAERARRRQASNVVAFPGVELETSGECPPEGGDHPLVGGGDHPPLEGGKSPPLQDSSSKTEEEEGRAHDTHSRERAESAVCAPPSADPVGDKIDRLARYVAGELGEEDRHAHYAAMLHGLAAQWMIVGPVSVELFGGMVERALAKTRRRRPDAPLPYLREVLTRLLDRATNEPETPETSKQRDEVEPEVAAIMEAFALSVGGGPETRAERAKWERDARDLAQSGVLPGDVVWLCEIYTEEWPTMPLTLHAIASNLTTLRDKAREQGLDLGAELVALEEAARACTAGGGQA